MITSLRIKKRFCILSSKVIQRKSDKFDDNVTKN